MSELKESLPHLKKNWALESNSRIFAKIEGERLVKMIKDPAEKQKNLEKQMKEGEDKDAVSNFSWRE